MPQRSSARPLEQLCAAVHGFPGTSTAARSGASPARIRSRTRLGCCAPLGRLPCRDHPARVRGHRGMTAARLAARAQLTGRPEVDDRDPLSHGPFGALVGGNRASLAAAVAVRTTAARTCSSTLISAFVVLLGERAEVMSQGLRIANAKAERAAWSPFRASRTPAGTRDRTAARAAMFTVIGNCYVARAAASRTSATRDATDARFALHSQAKTSCPPLGCSPACLARSDRYTVPERVEEERFASGLALRLKRGRTESEEEAVTRSLALSWGIHARSHHRSSIASV